MDWFDSFLFYKYYATDPTAWLASQAEQEGKSE